MSTVAQIREAIRVKIAAVANVGKVHDYERFSKAEKNFQDLYKDTADNRIRGWNFYREATSERDLDNGSVRRVHTWRITGFLSLDDADSTGKSFDVLVEAIATAFRTDRTLGGLVDDIKDMSQEDGPSGVQVDSVEPVIFAGVLCHRARMRLLTETTEASV